MTKVRALIHWHCCYYVLQTLIPWPPKPIQLYPRKQKAAHAPSMCNPYVSSTCLIDASFYSCWPPSLIYQPPLACLLLPNSCTLSAFPTTAAAAEAGAAVGKLELPEGSDVIVTVTKLMV